MVGMFASACIPLHIGDGICDSDNNVASCGNYDGGDCCKCSCQGDDNGGCNDPNIQCFPCGFGIGYDCVDPNTPTYYPYSALCSFPALTCSDYGFDGSTCAGGIDAYNPGSIGTTGDDCCECGPSIECTDRCDNWECVRG